MQKSNIHGVLLVDKPLGYSSNAVLQKVKRLFNAKKAGHTGSLDPLATGILPICFGEATKFSQHLLDSDKTYEVHALLGKRTSTGDAEGEVIQERDPSLITAAQIEQVIKQFQGNISQIPPMYSALKQNGQVLYKLARQGKEVERPARPVTIYSLHTDFFDLPTVGFTVSCSKGTYIRTLVEDIGDALGCGAHVTMLRRVKTAQYLIENSYTVEQLEALRPETAGLEALLLPIDSAIEDWPQITLSDEEAFYMRRGQALTLAEPVLVGKLRMQTTSHQFLGIGEGVEGNRLEPRRLVVS